MKTPKTLDQAIINGLDLIHVENYILDPTPITKCIIDFLSQKFQVTIIKAGNSNNKEAEQLLNNLWKEITKGE